jgi:hypothetical protein
MMRYVIRVEPVASADIPTLAAMVGPTIQRYLTGPVPEADNDAGNEAGDEARRKVKR